MLICPACRKTYPVTMGPVCSDDGSMLADAETFYQTHGDPLLGSVVARRYEVVSRIGVGGMGTVYRALQRPLAREVALKILKRELTGDPETVQRFHREARASSVLVHGNTVRVYDFGETSDGLLYLAMELLTGESLSGRLARPGSTSVVQAIDIASEILGSLAEAHSKGIVHRDLKPDNIFLARVDGHAEPVVKVLDFGVAKIITGDGSIDVLETQAGTVFGTPRYMSPEQAQGKKLDARSDLYSVGVLLFQMLTGRAPFTDDDAVIVMAKHIREAPPRPTSLVPDRPIPEKLERVVLRALAKTPQQRFPDAEHFAAALELCRPEAIEWEAAHQRGLPIPRRKHPAALVLGAAAAGVLLLGGAAALGVGLYASSAPASGSRAPTTVASTRRIAPDAVPTVGSERTTAPAAAIVQRYVMVQSEPDGAAVVRDGIELGRTPLSVAIGDRATRLELRAQGFQPAEALLGPDAGDVMLVALQPEGVSDQTPAARRTSPPGATKVRRPPPDRPASGRPTGSGRPSGPYAPLDR